MSFRNKFRPSTVAPVGVGPGMVTEGSECSKSLSIRWKAQEPRATSRNAWAIPYRGFDLRKGFDATSHSLRARLPEPAKAAWIHPPYAGMVKGEWYRDERAGFENAAIRHRGSRVIRFCAGLAHRSSSRSAHPVGSRTSAVAPGSLLLFSRIWRNGLMMSMGMGNTTVELCSAPISISVCR